MPKILRLPKNTLFHHQGFGLIATVASISTIAVLSTIYLLGISQSNQSIRNTIAGKTDFHRLILQLQHLLSDAKSCSSALANTNTLTVTPYRRAPNNSTPPALTNPILTMIPPPSQALNAWLSNVGYAVSSISLLPAPLQSGDENFILQPSNDASNPKSRFGRVLITSLKLTTKHPIDIDPSNPFKQTIYNSNFLSPNPGTPTMYQPIDSNTYNDSASSTTRFLGVLYLTVQGRFFQSPSKTTDYQAIIQLNVISDTNPLSTATPLPTQMKVFRCASLAYKDTTTTTASYSYWSTPKVKKKRYDMNSTNSDTNEQEAKNNLGMITNQTNIDIIGVCPEYQILIDGTCMYPDQASRIPCDTPGTFFLFGPGDSATGGNPDPNNTLLKIQCNQGVVTVLE